MSQVNHEEMKSFVNNLSKEEAKQFYKEVFETEDKIISNSKLDHIPSLIKNVIIHTIAKETAEYKVRQIDLNEKRHLHLESRVGNRLYFDFDLLVDYYVKGVDVRIDKIEMKFIHSKETDNSQCCSTKECCN